MRTKTASQIKTSGIIGEILIGIVAIVAGFKLIDYEDLPWLALCVMFFGSYLACVLGVLSAGLAELVDNIDYLKTIAENTKPQISAPVPQSAAPQQNMQTPPVSQKVSAPPAGPVKAIVSSENPDMIFCPQCNTEQLARRKVCWKCGVKFK